MPSERRPGVETLAAEPRLLTLPPASRRWPELGRHPSTWYRRWRAGELPPGAIVVLSGRPYVRVAVIEAWLNGEDSPAAAGEASTPAGRRLRAV